MIQPSERLSTLKRLIRPALSLLRWEGALLLAALGFGLVSAFATRWFWSFVLLSLVMLYLTWARAFGESLVSDRFRRRAQAIGIWVWALLLGLVGLAVFWRFSQWWGALLFGIGYLVVAAWHVWWLARRGGESALQFRQSLALSLLPILAAWIVNSSVYQLYQNASRMLGEGRLEQTSLDRRLEERTAAIDGRGTSIALTLSGGGYRAAALHSGVLWVLDEAGISVDLLSTVSGGSIVGAAYAMGQSAAEFRDRLKRSRPGLPNDLSNFYPVVAQLFFPGYGSGDTYANHFDRTFFSGRRLEQTGPPYLILNTTRYADGTRRAFHAESDGHLSLARLVAASGAFPVAFDPVAIEGDRYIDGGVVENLGVAGVQQFLEAHARDSGLADLVPGVLILSDAGLIPKPPPEWTKPSVLQMALRAQQTSYFAMHRWIYSFYTEGAYDRVAEGPVQQPFSVEAGRLWPTLPQSLASRRVEIFVLSPSSPTERSRFAGNEALLDAVSSLDTLKELSADEVEAAFWVGARLAEAYLPAICRAAASDCARVAIGSAPPVPK